MKRLTFFVLLLIALSRLSVAYNTWTVTDYWETYTYWKSTYSAPCSVSTETIVIDGPSSFYLPQTDCPWATVSWDEGIIYVTPTAPVQGYSTKTVTISAQIDSEYVTIIGVEVELYPDQLPTPTTTAIEPSFNGYGYVLPNGTVVALMQPVLFTAPASCTPGVVTTFLTTLTQSDYSFTSTLPVSLAGAGLLPQVTALATSTATVTHTTSGTITTIQYFIPPDILPVAETQSEYGPDMCVDPRVTATTATPTTTSSRSNGKKSFVYQGAYMTAIPAAIAAAGMLL